MFGFVTPDVPEITVEEVKKAIESGKDVLLLDVRTPEEFSRNRIKGSINLPVNQLASSVDSIVPNKQKLVYVYCLSASRSVHAVQEMRELGYEHVYNMTSGLLAWRAKQYPLES